MSRFPQYLSKEQEYELRRTANALVAPGKGILAADESPDTMGRRLKPFNIGNDAETRRKYRQLLFTTGKELSNNISGTILYPETFYQKTDDGTPFVKLLHDCGIFPGITLDKGLVQLGGTEEETTTQGLDGLGERAQQYAKDGAKFAKWRCALTIGKYTPSYLAMLENANVLARYASICQQNGLVPIVEPEIKLAGDHDLATAQKVTEQVLAFQYKALADHHVFLEGTLLKANMVVAGLSCPTKYTPEQVASATMAAIGRRVPAAVAGLTFMTGGQSEKDSTVHLNAINKFPGRKPWVLTFCFARALQTSALQAWSGKDDQVKAAQGELLKRAKANGEASLGQYAG